MDSHLNAGVARTKLPFRDDMPSIPTQSSALPQKRKPEQLGLGAKRQRQSPLPDGKPQKALPPFNITKNVTTSSNFVSKDGRPFAEEYTNDQDKIAFIPSSGPVPPINSALSSRRNPGGTSSPNDELFSTLHPQTQTPLGTRVSQDVSNADHTQNTAQTQTTIVVPIHVKRKDDANDWHIPAPGNASGNKHVDKTDYFEDDEGLLEDWLNLACDKAVEEETYSIGSSQEADLINLTDIVVSAFKQTPPTSVLKDMDASSIVEVFDPSLQHSPPAPTNEHASTKPKQPETEEELLDADVDWDALMLQLPDPPRNLSISPQLPTQTVHIKTEPISPPPSNIPKPFARPPFPAPVRDKSPIIGVSHNTVLRTCFRVGQFISEGNRCHREKQDAIFELYARVKFSSRESNRRVQHFQFADIFKDQQPYPTGILEGWKTESLLEKHSAAFLHTGKNHGEAKMCRCMCRLKREKNELGWIVDVLSIEEANWNDVELVRAVVCRE
ncbi:hypothetical protein QBC38DRAFT_514301 [Podospora fimiseda]|uniref:Uncharacterized protein n=1 Tax=Podospora fimiseda TaxID=252190 RepID=A0AAN7H5K5_9PEZI|nr:hypothetical protein QBC38DRAFT_514301 [Podospora fimiseda]